MPNLSDLVAHGIEYKKYTLTNKIGGILVQAVKFKLVSMSSTNIIARTDTDT